MAENLYFVNNSPLPVTTGWQFTSQPTGTAVCNMLQLSTPSTRQFSLVEWGISFDGAPAAIKVQVRVTGTASTMSTAGVILPFSNPNAPTSLSTSGTSNTGFSTGAITPAGTTSAIFDQQIISANQYVKQWPLAREPVIPVSAFCIIAVTAATSVGASCYFIWRE